MNPPSPDGPASRSDAGGLGHGRTRPFDDLHSRLRAHASATPSAVALTFLSSSLRTERIDLTYADVVERSLRVGRVLSNRFEPGERVLLVLPSTPEFPVAFLACLAAGVVAVPLPLPLDESSSRRVLTAARDCAPSAILSTRLVRDLLSTARVEFCHREDWVLVDDIQHSDAILPTPEDARDVLADDIAFLQYTSGSTSSPHGVMVSHRSLMANEAAIADLFQVAARSTIVSWLPLHHDMGLVGGLLQPLYAGARGVILDPASFVRRPASWLEAISDERADISGAPNFAYDLCTRTVSAKTKARLDLSSWRVAFNGAAPVFPKTLRAFSEAFEEAGFRPAAHVPCYGLAEATLLVTAATVASRRCRRSFSVASLDSGMARETDPDSPAVRELVAYPLPAHATVRVVDRVTAEPLGEGVVGEIVVAGDSNASGYWGDRPGSAARFALTLRGEAATPFVRTGDLGFILDDELFIQGRSKDLIIHRGRNLHPDDIEADISSCDRAVRPGCGAVFGIPDDGDEAIIVCQEVSRATSLDRCAQIAHAIRATIARIHGVTAHTVVLVPPRTVSKTTSGKLERHRVAQRFLVGELPALYSHTVERQAVRSTSLAERLAAIDRHGTTAVDRLTVALCEHFRDLLDLPSTPPGDASPISLGADSLTAQQIVYELEEALGLAASPSLLLRAASIADLAAATLAARSPTESTVPSSDAIVTEYELNAAQRALWFLQRVSPQSTAYNITRAFRVTGKLDVDALTAALTEAVQRHLSLRLAVRTVNGEPQARIRPPHAARVDVIDARSWNERALLTWHRELATTPFDLERDPLFRAVALRRTDDWLLVLSLHHIVCDGSSLATIIDELADEYRAGAGRGASPFTGIRAITGGARAGRARRAWRSAHRVLAACSGRGDSAVGSPRRRSRLAQRWCVQDVQLRRAADVEGGAACPALGTHVAQPPSFDVAGPPASSHRSARHPGRRPRLEVDAIAGSRPGSDTWSTCSRFVRRSIRWRGLRSSRSRPRRACSTRSITRSSRCRRSRVSSIRIATPRPPPCSRRCSRTTLRRCPRDRPPQPW